MHIPRASRNLSKPVYKSSLTILTLIFLTVATVPALAQSPYGSWARGDGNTRVQITPCGAEICATNTWIRKTGTEKVGHVLVMKVRKIAAGLWKGSAYDPQRKLTISMQMKVKRRSMTTSGCIIAGLLCKSTNWTRLK